MQDYSNVVENPVMGRPYVVVLLDEARYSVRVVSHEKTLLEATELAEQIVGEGYMETSCHVVTSDKLRAYLGSARNYMAARMADNFLSAES